MTTTPTPEQIKNLIHAANHGEGNRDWRRDLLQVATACEALIADRITTEGALHIVKVERDQARAAYDRETVRWSQMKTERDRALARVAELELQYAALELEQSHARLLTERNIWRERAEKAEARVKELEAYDTVVHAEGWAKEAHDSRARVAVLREALESLSRQGGRWTAVTLKNALATEDQAAEALLAERDRLKAQLDVAVGRVAELEAQIAKV